MVAVVLHNSDNEPQFLYSFDGNINGSSTGCCKEDGERDFFGSISFSWNFLEVCGNKMVWNRYERRHSTWRNNEVFRLNVGGKSFCFRPDTVLDHREPNSLLARLVRLEHHQRLMLTDGFQHGEYYLERNSKVAEHVLDYFLTGKLHKPPEICPQRFSEELLFWRLTRVELAPCCSVLTDTQQKLKRTLDTERQLDQVNCCRGLRKVIWHLLESPSSSLFSKLFTLLSVIFIVASVVGLVLGSMPEFQADSRFADSYHALLGARKGYSSSNLNENNMTTTTMPTTLKMKKMKLPVGREKFKENKNGSNFVERATTTRPSRKESPPPSPQVFIYRPTDNPQRWLVILENCCIAWFTMDFLLRLLVAPRRWLFLRQPLNLIDLFTVLPFYCELALSQMGVSNTEGLKDFAGAMLVMRVLRVLRMARVFKLARYSTGLQVFGATLRTSLRELCMLSMFLLCGTIFFSTLMYYAEKDEPGSDFKSIPAACWWCIITVTTVGYGDCQILSWVGKLIAGLSSVFGIIILAFPISMVVENFAVAQQKLKLENQLKEVQMSQVANDYLMRRYPSRRKACRDPLDGSLHRHQQQQPQNINQKIPSSPPLTDLSSNVLNAPYSALSENFVLATN